MWRCSCVALLLPVLLLLLWDGGADAAPLLGLLSLLASNGTDIVSTLLLEHIQDKVNKLETLADFIAIAANGTG